jgi:hypothetical protein
MQGALQKGVAGAAALALVVAGTALGKPFLPKRAAYAGTTARGGTLAFTVRHHHIVLITGKLPVRSGGTCQYAKEREAPLRLHNYNPVGNGPFTIKATQRAVNHHTGDWRKLHIRIQGRFDAQAEKANGTLHVRFHDQDGRCETRDQVRWRVHRRHGAPKS